MEGDREGGGQGRGEREEGGQWEEVEAPAWAMADGNSEMVRVAICLEGGLEEDPTGRRGNKQLLPSSLSLEDVRRKAVAGKAKLFVGPWRVPGR